MAANNGDTGFARDLTAAAENLTEQVLMETVARKADDVQGKERPGAHRIKIRERIGRGDAAEVERIIDDGREKVDGRHECPVSGDPVHGSVVYRTRIDEYGRVSEWNHVAQHLRQLGGAEFTGSTRAV
jgi:hypothetical protein